MKPKEYLFSIGKIEKVGRGRLSQEMKDICAKAAANGTFIEGYSNTPAPVTKKAAPVKPKADKPVITEADIKYTYPENEYRAYYFRNGKKTPVGMREVCHSVQCGVSLVACRCLEPNVVDPSGGGSGFVRVYIERS